MANRTYHPRGQLVDGFAVREHPLYGTWANMHSRCYNPESSSYENYGARGITVCARWHDFAVFAADMGLKPSANLSLERQDNDGHYTPQNCVWDTRTQQCVNRRTFKSNTSGARGVVQTQTGFQARFDFERVRYSIGYFDTLEEAAQARERFVDLFYLDKEYAVSTIGGVVARRNSQTKIRGVNPHQDGGFIARVTVNKQRKYLGYFKTLEAAQQAIMEAKQ